MSSSSCEPLRKRFKAESPPHDHDDLTKYHDDDLTQGLEETKHHDDDDDDDEIHGGLDLPQLLPHMLTDGTAQVARRLDDPASDDDDKTQGLEETTTTTRPRDDDKPSTVTVRAGSIVNLLDPQDLSKVLKTIRIKQDLRVTLAKNVPSPAAQEPWGGGGGFLRRT